MHETGCDDDTDGSRATDICAKCAFKSKFQPALYNCFDCGMFGRFLCGDCKSHHSIKHSKHEVVSISASTMQARRKPDWYKQQEEIIRLRTDLEIAKRQHNEATYAMQQKDEKINEMKKKYKLCVEQAKHKEKTMPLAKTSIELYFDERLQLGTTYVYRAAKSMKDMMKDIIRKQKRDFSKHLSECKNIYLNSFKELQNTIEQLSNTLQTRERVPSKAHRWGTLQTRERVPFEAYRWGSERQLYKTDVFMTQSCRDAKCLRCMSKDKQIKESNANLNQVLASKDEVEENLRHLKNQSVLLKQQYQTEVDKNRRLEEQFAILKQQLQTEKDMKDDALRRLSAMSSSKLRDKNPNITDQNRPTKIAEKLSDLYDNQWTDALDYHQKDGKQDETIIRELFTMLMDVFNECSRLAKDRFFEKVQDIIEFPVERRVRDRPVELPDQLKQQVKEFRRVRATTVLREVEEVVLENLGLVNQPKDIQSYLAHCVKIGWLAAVQDPPLALCGKSPDRFDTNVFKDYTQRGPYVEFVVWPALLLHENGPLLAKGVAQGCSVKPTSSLQIPYPAQRQNADATVSRTRRRSVLPGALQEMMQQISDGFESIESDKPSTEIYYRGSGSLNTPREKQRPALCEWCEQKEKCIEDIRQELTKDKNLSKHNEETLNQVLALKDEIEENLRHLEKQYTLLKQQCQTEVDKNRLLEVQFSILQQQLQTEKDNSLRRLNQVFASKDEVEEYLRCLEKEHALIKQQCQTEVDKSGRLEEYLSILNEQLQNEKDMKDDALRRLSTMATKKLRDSEPNITDLSDPNRPTKIAEKLSELYDNQWTDAFDALQIDGKQDETIIQELRKMLMDVFYECSCLANDRFFERVQDSIEFPVQRKVGDRTMELPNKLKQHVNEFRQVRATKVLKEIQKVVLENLELVNQPNDIQSYLAHCVEIGWLAAVQDPPLALCGNSADQFDTNVFKDYTQRGPYVEYVVWPALLLHENGPLLAKGVAQGCSIKPMSSLQSSYPAQRQNADTTVSSTRRRSVFPGVLQEMMQQALE